MERVSETIQCRVFWVILMYSWTHRIFFPFVDFVKISSMWLDMKSFAFFNIIFGNLKLQMDNFSFKVHVEYNAFFVRKQHLLKFSQWIGIV